MDNGIKVFVDIKSILNKTLFVCRPLAGKSALIRAIYSIFWGAAFESLFCYKQFRNNGTLNWLHLEIKT